VDKKAIKIKSSFNRRKDKLEKEPNKGKA